MGNVGDDGILQINYMLCDRAIGILLYRLLVFFLLLFLKLFSLFLLLISDLFDLFFPSGLVVNRVQFREYYPRYPQLP